MALTTEPTRGVKGLFIRLASRSRSQNTVPTTATASHQTPRRLQRLSQSVQRWRRARNAHANEHVPGVINKSDSFTSNHQDMPPLERFSEDCPPVGTTHEGTQHEDSSNGSGPRELVSKEVIPQQTISQPVISQEVILQEPTPQRVLPSAKCVYRQTRDHAKQFAQSMMATCFMPVSNTTRIFWTGASLQTSNCQHHHGGIAIAQLSETQWTIRHAHVAGLTNACDFEALAVMTALETVLQDEPAKAREVLIFCDSQQVLSGLEKCLAPFPAMRHAVQVYASTKDHRHALASFWESYELGRMDRLDGSHLSPIRERTLAAYYQLLERGTSVQFHWVPAHEDILGNDVADQWASYARRWYKNFTTTCLSLSEVMVFPLATVQLECNHLGLPMTGENITEIQARDNLEISKDLRYSLLTSNRLGEAFTTTDTAVPTTAVVLSTVPHKIATTPPQLDEDQVPTAVNQTEAAVQQRPAKRQRQCQKCGRRGHAAAHCEQRTLRASCGLEDNSHTEDECYTTRSTLPNALIIADRLRQQLSTWQAWSFWPLLVEVIIESILVVVIYVYGGGLVVVGFWEC